MDILTLISKTGATYKKASSTRGGIYKGPCPWCGGNDRFSIYPNDNTGWYICNQCKKTGDAIQFERDYNHATFKEACERTGETTKLQDKPSGKTGKADKTGKISTNHVSKPEVWLPRSIENPNSTWVSKSESLLFSSFKFLLSTQGQAHREYLHIRGLTDETLKKARIGYNPRSINYDYDAFGLPPELDQKGKPKTIWIPDGIIIPHFTDKGIRRLRIRNANPKGKNPYILLTGGTTEYLIYPDFSTSKKTMVVESELDGWLMWQIAGDLINVMAAGNAQTRPDAVAFELLESCPGVLCSFDFDEAGQTESKWWSYHIRSKWWPVPSGKDPGEAFQLGVDLRSWAESGVKDCAQVGVCESLTSLSGDYQESLIPEYAPGKDNGLSAMSESRQITVRNIDELTRCKNGQACIHIHEGRCLMNGEYIYHIEACPKKKWWMWSDPECDGISMMIKGCGRKAR